MAQRCGLVQPYIKGFTWVKYIEEPPFKMWHKEWRQCANDATVVYFDGWLTFHWCEHHQKVPST